MGLNKKGMIFGRINIVDLIFILTVIALVCGTYFKFAFVGKEVHLKNMQMIQYQVEVEDIRQVSVDAMAEGMEVYDSKLDISMGKIIKQDVSPMLRWIKKTDGTFVKAERPDQFKVVLTIDALGIETDESYLVNGTLEIKRETAVVLKTKYVQFVSRIINVRAIDL
jgi:hypothetical protein